MNATIFVAETQTKKNKKQLTQIYNWTVLVSGLTRPRLMTAVIGSDPEVNIFVLFLWHSKYKPNVESEP